MHCFEDELWYLWKYGQRLLRSASSRWSITQQMEAFEELDVMATTTPSARTRALCLDVLTSRPDVAMLVKFGVGFGTEAARALFADMCHPAKLAVLWPANLLTNCQGYEHQCAPWHAIQITDLDHFKLHEVQLSRAAGGRHIVVAIVDTGFELA